MMISAIIIAKNEEERIAACLESVAFCDERIVVDNGSSDKTIAISKRYNAIVLEAKGKDFSSVREVGLRQAKGKWVLYIDADEVIGESLQKEIISIVHKSTQGAYFILRDTYYLGHHWPYKDKVERLFLRSALKGWHGPLHETPIYTGEVSTLRHSMTHRTHRTLEEMVAKTNEWSNVEALLRYKADHPPIVWWRFLRVMMTGFIRSFIDQRGWRAGTVGWIESIFQAFSMFITYAKLWELQQKKSGQ